VGVGSVCRISGAGAAALFHVKQEHDLREALFHVKQEHDLREALFHVKQEHDLRDEAELCGLAVRSSRVGATAPGYGQAAGGLVG
jgi:hypothetical protein